MVVMGSRSISSRMARLMASPMVISPAFALPCGRYTEKKTEKAQPQYPKKTTPTAASPQQQQQPHRRKQRRKARASLGAACLASQRSLTSSMAQWASASALECAGSDLALTSSALAGAGRSL